MSDSDAHDAYYSNKGRPSKERREWLDKVEERFKKPLNGSMVVAYINDTVGYGLFTQKNIACGSIIALYSGQFESPSGAAYELTSALMRHPNFPAMQEKAVSGDYAADLVAGTKTNAAVLGGMARFMQHMPINERETLVALNNATTTIELVQFLYCGVNIAGKPLNVAKAALRSALQAAFSRDPYNSAVQQAINDPITPIASANVHRVASDYKGYPFSFMVASRDIVAGEQLGWSYGDDSYWKNRGLRPLFFDKNTGYSLSQEDTDKIYFPVAKASLEPVPDSILPKTAASSSLSVEWAARGFLDKGPGETPSAAKDSSHKGEAAPSANFLG